MRKARGDGSSAAHQPHRRPLPGDGALDGRAESPLGRLLLRGLLRRAGEPDDERAARRYDAGILFAQIYGAHAAAIGAPAGLAGSGRGFECGADDSGGCRLAECVCIKRRRRYETAIAALRRAGGSAAGRVAAVAVWGDELVASELVHLVRGLEALALHFGDCAPGARKERLK